MAFCTNCGKEIPEGTKFCSNCGAPMDAVQNSVDSVENPEEISEAQTPAKTGLIMKFSGLFGLALIISIICLIVGINNVKSKGAFGNKQKESVSESYTYEKPDSSDDIDDYEIEDDEENEKDEKDEETEDIEEIEEEVKEEAKEEIEEDTAKDTAKEEGVDPELKAFLDEYEAFVDEYVTFMKKYNDNPGNAASMIVDYTKLVAKEEKMAEKLEKYDKDEMSKADAKYYLDVVNRCNQKMLDLY